MKASRERVTVENVAAMRKSLEDHKRESVVPNRPIDNRSLFQKGTHVTHPVVEFDACRADQRLAFRESAKMELDPWKSLRHFKDAIPSVQVGFLNVSHKDENGEFLRQWLWLGDDIDKGSLDILTRKPQRTNFVGYPGRDGPMHHFSNPWRASAGSEFLLSEKHVATGPQHDNLSLA